MVNGGIPEYYQSFHQNSIHYNQNMSTKINKPALGTAQFCQVYGITNREGYAEESCRLPLDYGFNELCLNKVWIEIYEFDEKKKALYNKFGFHQDGLLRQNYWYDRKW